MSNPTFRQDLLATREEQQGVVYYRIEDPVAKTTFRLYEMEYLMAQKLDGHHSPDAVIQEVNNTLHFQLTKDDMARFITQLESMNILAAPAEDDDAVQSADKAEPSDTLMDLDPIEEERLLTNALLQIKQGYFGHAKDYFLELKEACPNDKRHNTMINHLSIIGEDPTASDMEFIWEQILKLYPQMAHRIGAPVTMPHQGNQSPVANTNSRKGLYAMIGLAAVAVIAALAAFNISAAPQYNVKTAAPAVWDDPLYNPGDKANISIINSHNLSFGMKGKVETINIQEGSQVSKGAVLASLKLPPNQQKPLAQATAKARQAELTVNDREQAVARNNERLAALTEKKISAMENIKELGRSKAPKDRAQVQKLKKQLAKYNKDLASGQKLKVQLNKQLAEGKKAQRQAQAALDKLLAKPIYKKSIIKAPIDGVISQIAIKENSPAVKPAMIVIAPHELEISFELAADSQTDYQAGQGVAILQKSDNGFNKIPATVSSLDGRILHTKVIDITATLYQQDPAGFFLENNIEQTVYKIPAALVKNNAAQQFVWVVGQDTTVSKVNITSLYQRDGFVLATGKFNTQDKLITAASDQKNNPFELTEGLSVIVQP